MRPTETILQPEEGEVTFTFTNPGPSYNLDPPLRAASLITHPDGLQPPT
ncbi:hypothetical protein DSM3645_27493 [Blastopirellula marina DSM 3645]|uniref:Uncharacterized protein n=1 Tax=Blastopirellula marina DSM 3645 TaxID=314230 RepID=A3ZX20_9BACT|nr:hypothetical protein DSM3645_27493 [Blastopirellula marina DSM 3645]